MLVAMSAVALAALGQGLFASRGWGIFIFGCLGIAAAWSLSTLMPVVVSGAVAPETQGRVLGTLNLLWNLAMTLSALVGGALLEVRPGLPFLVASTLALCGVLVVGSFFRRSAQEPAFGA